MKIEDVILLWHLQMDTSPIHTMTKLELKGNWNIAQGALKQQWAQSTDDDLQYLDGKEAELLGRIQKRTGETREAVEYTTDETCKG